MPTRYFIPEVNDLVRDVITELPDDLAYIREAVDEIAASQACSNTTLAYASDWRNYERYLKFSEFTDAYALNRDEMLGFPVWGVYLDGKKLSTVTRWLLGVRAGFRRAGAEFPFHSATSSVSWLSCVVAFLLATMRSVRRSRSTRRKLSILNFSKRCLGHSTSRRWLDVETMRS